MAFSLAFFCENARTTATAGGLLTCQGHLGRPHTNKFNSKVRPLDSLVGSLKGSKKIVLAGV